MKWRLVTLVVLTAGSSWAGETPTTVTDSLKTILAVKAEGVGNTEAAQAWKTLVSNSQTALFPTLEAFNAAKPTSANWLRSAVDGIVQAEEKAGRKLPVAELVSFIQNSKQHPDARRIAYELVEAREKPKAEALLANLVNDPNPDLRRDAIESEVKKADALKEKPEQLAALSKLFKATRDKDQAEEIGEKLEKLGEKVDLTRHFNYITEWKVIGPFDSTGGKGFTESFAPEKKVNLNEELTGKGGAKLKWVAVQSDDTYGNIDLNKTLTKFKDALGYAHAVIVSPKEQPAEIRVASQNSIQIFLNGSKIFEREEYHHGSPMDGHIAKGTLKAGKNEILIKVLQNDQKEAWAQVWAFSARVCDSTGGRFELQQSLEDGEKSTLIPLGRVLPAPKDDKKKEKK